METSPRTITDIGDQQSELQRDPAALAIERLLQAERAADAKLSECRQQAEAVVAAAREHAAAIARRVDTRISQLHSAYLKKIDNAVAELAIPAPAGTGTGASDSELAKAAYRLAAKLAGDT
jgi:vacuolar-type H+-ATPase subunit H